MTTYRAPTSDILDALEVGGLTEVLGFPAFSHVDRSTVEQAVTELGRLSSDIIAPTNRIGDTRGAWIDPSSGTVTVPEEMKMAYKAFVQGGWGALQFPAEWGGGDFPSLVATAVQEMIASSNLALSLNPTLTQTAIELLLAWGNESQQARFLPRLLSGEWSGTMILTEPEAGSDVGQVRTRAEKSGDHWALTGTKIFITWGEHDMTDNIVHLVLARAPGAPPGTKGLSLFIAPRLIVDDEGRCGARNAISCLRLEEKIGIHGSPTCVMQFDGAHAELVGPLHGGMSSMFTMMNSARLSIGLQGPSVGETAYQLALEYANTRVQGRVVGSPATGTGRIVEHPDVQRMLLTMRVLTLASRMLVYTAFGYKDVARHGPDEGSRARARAHLDLFTPVVKAWSSDNGVEITSLGIQVLGGIGYIEETGMAQLWRDSRIAPIYEGTNGIQAVDLVMRKLPQENGRWINGLIREMSDTTSECRQDKSLHECTDIMEEALNDLTATTEWMLQRVNDAPVDALAGATSYLEMLGITTGGWMMMKRAALARNSQSSVVDRNETGDQTSASKHRAAAAEASFFASEILAKTKGLLRPVTSGAARLAGMAGRATSGPIDPAN